MRYTVPGWFPNRALVGVTTGVAVLTMAGGQAAAQDSAPAPAQVKKQMKRDGIAMGRGATPAKDVPAPVRRTSPRPSFGPLKRVPGLGQVQFDARRHVYRGKNPDGSSYETHGPDPAGSADAADTLLPASDAYAPPCVRSGHRLVLVYVHVSGNTDRYSTVAPLIRSYIRRANTKLVWEAVRSSSASSDEARSAAYKVDCDANGLYTVAHVDAASNEFDEVNAKTRAQLGSPSGKDAVRYVTFVDSPAAAGAAGLGQLLDSASGARKSASCANGAWCMTLLSVTYRDYWDTHVVMHEIGHTLGAVQTESNPTASGVGHCTDGSDIMCYSDYTGSPYSTTKCPVASYGSPETFPFDCGYDTYFNTSAPHSPRTWTDLHWNVGGKEDDFLQFNPKWPSSVSGDRKSDLVVGDTPSGQFATAVSNGATLAASGSGSGWWLTAFGGAAPWGATGDVNGDGASDLVLRSSAGVYTVELSNGTSFGATGSGTWATTPSTTTWAALGDFDGDGKDDLIYADSAGAGSFKVRISTGETFLAATTWQTGWGGSPSLARVGDFNGDGKDDLLVAIPSTDQYAVTMSTGTQFGAPGGGVWLSGWSASPNWAGIGDFNGDGKDDLIVADPTLDAYAVALSNGTQFGAPGTGVWQSGWGSHPDWAGVGDYNGDRKDDLILYVAAFGMYAVTLSDGTKLGAPGTQFWLSSWAGPPQFVAVG